MKRQLFLGATMSLAVFLSFGQTTGSSSSSFGANGTAGPVFLGGNAEDITHRILSSTSYKVTPGDTFLLTITMNGEATYPLVLMENYELEVPFIGTLNARGLYFAELRKKVTEGLKKAIPLADFIGFVLESPARFDVPVFGGVKTPGIVTVNPLTRVSDAISLAGGRKDGASYRRIALIRGDRRTIVDLLRYGIDAASEENPYLEPGDKLYVPPQEILVVLSGQVKFPGPYELIPGETLAMLISYGGGTLPDARVEEVEIVHFGENGTSTQRIIDLKIAAEVALANGDRVRIPSTIENREMILLTGAFFGAPVSTEKPIAIPLAPVSVNVPYSPGLSLLTVLETVGGPTPYARSKEGLLIRKRTGERLSVDLDALWTSKDPAKDLALEPGDTVSVPMVYDVFVLGEVRSPGRVPYNPSFTVGDYLVAAGGIQPDTGDPTGLYFVDTNGNRARTDTSHGVVPGALIFVDRNWWTNTQRLFNDIAVWTGFVTGILGFTTTLINFWKFFFP